MRSIGILLLFVCLVARAAPVSHDSSVATNSADGSHRPSIYVDGQVQKPGRYDWFQGMTVVDAITVAGGLKQSASHRIEIIRDDSRVIFHADTFPYGVKKPPLLKAGDFISVPSERPGTAPVPSPTAP